MDRPVYLDNAASMRPYPEVVALASQIALECYANPSSLHAMGCQAELLLEKARKQVLSILAPEDSKENPLEVIFTSGATEGNNIAILGAARGKASYSKRLITTTAEHDSAKRPFDLLEKEGYEVHRLRVASDGEIRWEEYRSLLSRGVGLISAIACSNQTGVLLPVERMAALAKKICPRGLFHTDATQAVGKVRVDLSDVDLMTFSGHKIGGVRGSGVLLKRKNASLLPPEVGGGQENGLRSGTPNTPGAVALALALRLSYESLPRRRERAAELNAFIRRSLSGVEGIELLSPEEKCIPFVLSYGLARWKASVMDEFLSERGIYASTTSACDDRQERPNEILRSMGFSPHVADNPIRLSFCGEEGIEQGKRFVEAFREGLLSLKPDA